MIKAILSIITGKLNRIEANTAHVKAQNDELKSAIDRALKLLEAATPVQLELPLEPELVYIKLGNGEKVLARRDK